MASGKLPSERAWEIARDGAMRRRPDNCHVVTLSTEDILQMLDERLGREMTREDITGEPDETPAPPKVHR